MTLQKKTLQRYRQLYPQKTLREISAQTGIQITRVFRLFNGKTMKVGELEAFESAIMLKLAENPNHTRLNDLLEQASGVLTSEEFGKIANYVERKIFSRNYSRFYISQNLENADIA